MKNVRLPLTLVLITLLLLYVAFSQTQEPLKYYAVQLDDHGKIYDGDTIQDVAITLKVFQERTEAAPEVLWPGIVFKGDTLYAITDIRIAGIDTPEKRPKKAGRTQASLDREKSAAAAATQALTEILEAHDYNFYLANPQLGKYAGRIVADIYVGPEKQRVATRLIESGHAKQYDGGTKPVWNWGQ